MLCLLIFSALLVISVVVVSYSNGKRKFSGSGRAVCPLCVCCSVWTVTFELNDYELYIFRMLIHFVTTYVDLTVKVKGQDNRLNFTVIQLREEYIAKEVGVASS